MKHVSWLYSAMYTMSCTCVIVSSILFFRLMRCCYFWLVVSTALESGPLNVCMRLSYHVGNQFSLLTQSRVDTQMHPEAFSTTSSYARAAASGR
jgi:hypothetical protein